MVDTIKFNVGGRHFEVSRQLVEQNPYTMLAKMISETWETDDPDKPLFIDRDGEKFAHVLDYLRYGSIELPESIPESMFKRELDYYGIIANDGSVVQWKKKTLGEIMTDVKCQVAKAEENEHILALAVECLSRYNEKSVQGRQVSFFLRDSCGWEYWAKKGMNSDSKSVKTLSEYLEQYFGLRVFIRPHKRAEYIELTEGYGYYYLT
eukprot:scaffold16542_cov74-Cyclotella_meneghiniana.AAC.2